MVRTEAEASTLEGRGMPVRIRKQPPSSDDGTARTLKGKNVCPMPPTARPGRGRESYYFTPIADAERRLWAAIVTDAVEICLGRTLVSAEERHAARRWIESRGTDVGGFLWCCHLLGLDDDAISDRIGTVRPRPSAMESRRRLILGYSRPQPPAQPSRRLMQDLTRPARH